jgi:dynein heavy chain
LRLPPTDNIHQFHPTPLEHQNQIAVALITIDVHNRDITEDLLASGVSSPHEFGWAGRLRYEFDPDTDGVVVRQVNAR